MCDRSGVLLTEDLPVSYFVPRALFRDLRHPPLPVYSSYATFLNLLHL